MRASGTAPGDAAQPPERGVSYADQNCAGERWDRRIFERCNFDDGDPARLSTTNCTFVECDFSHADLRHSMHERSAFVSCAFREST